MKSHTLTTKEIIAYDEPHLHVQLLDFQDGVPRDRDQILLSKENARELLKALQDWVFK